MNGLALEYDPTGDRTAIRPERMLFHVLLLLRGEAVARDMIVGAVLGEPDGSPIRVAKACRRLGERVEHRLQIEGRATDDLQHVGGGSLLLQRFVKLTGARFELLFQLAQRIGPVATARFRLGSGRTKLAGARWTICTFARQGHLVGTVTGAPIAACGPPKSSILPELCSTHLGLPDARTEFEPGIFVRLQCGALRRLALPGMQSREHDPKRLQGPRCEMQQKRQRHFAFVLRCWLTWFCPQVCQNLALRERQSFCFVPSISAPRLRRFLTRPICAAEQSSSKVALRSLG